MNRIESSYHSSFSFAALIAVGVAVFSFGCKTKEPDAPVSATVQPADPSAIAPGSGGAGNAVPGTNSYVGTADGAPTAGSSGVKTTYSGLQYEVLRPGTGQRPTPYNRVKVHYHGYLPNGTVFDSSVQRGTPATFGLSQVIAGWKEGIPLMREGAKYRFTVPGHLAYGARGMPPKIGPNQTLKFDVELFEVLY